MEVDPSTQNVFAAAFGWLADTLTGTVATSISVIAIASIGLLLMTGRVHSRRAINTILGCFLIFGASSIAIGIMRGLNDQVSPNSAVLAPAAVPIARTSVPNRPVGPYDPYAGAALPVR